MKKYSHVNAISSFSKFFHFEPYAIGKETLYEITPLAVEDECDKHYPHPNSFQFCCEMNAKQSDHRDKPVRRMDRA